MTAGANGFLRKDREYAMPEFISKDPLHGITLEQIVKTLVDQYGWEDLGTRIDIRCFTHEPSVNSALKFLRKTPWAREKIERLYLSSQRKKRKQG